MAQSERHQRFMDAVSSLKLKFPGAEIGKRTGYHKATISSYLGEREPSEDFVKTFSEKFGFDFEQLWFGDAGDPADDTKKNPSLQYLSRALADQAEANKIQAIANKENAEAINKFASAIERMNLNFGTILTTQDAGFGLVAELVNRQVRKDAKGNEEKAQADLDEIAQRIGPGLGPIASKGIGADGGNQDIENS